MRRLNFSVDAKLLRELGERLVGRPHIALGELIKNSYDADARHVDITFDGDEITISDDGHGMSEKAFEKRWMRIGTTHKSEDRVSPGLLRPLTGSKGVGRLSVQLLAAKLELRSTPLLDKRAIGEPRAAVGPQIFARIDWRNAVQKDQLTDVQVDFSVQRSSETYADGSPYGTRITLSGLSAEWSAEQFEALAQEIWALQPPFTVEDDDEAAFAVRLITPSPAVQASFDQQMTAIMQVANATIVGRMLHDDEIIPDDVPRFALPVARGPVDEDGELDDGVRPDDGVTTKKAGAPTRYALIEVDLTGYPQERFVAEIENCQLSDLDFEVRVFDLRNRQPKGIAVDTARRYFSKFGGVHIYDNGFRLPYYGPDVDWLRLELDHARRISRSQMLPEFLQVRNAMQDLPSNKRVFGVAKISTSEEAIAATAAGRSPSNALSIQITRDRLTDNLAFSQLSQAVRLSLDLYATARARSKVRRILEAERPSRGNPNTVVREALQTVEAIRPELSPASYVSLRDALETVASDVELRTQESRAYASLLGSLATAGMTSLAYEHEISNQRGEVIEVASQLRIAAANASGDQRRALEELAERLTRWERRADRIRGLLRPLLDEESRTTAGRHKAKKLAADVVDSLRVLARTTQVDLSAVPNDLVLPMGTYTAWSAVLQNLLVNAFRATLEAKPALVRIDGGTANGRAWLRVQDNGSGGVDLATAHRLFLPFERQAAVSERAEILGLGGSGLGLTIVRMITDEIGCSIKFVEPEASWSTAVRLEWRNG
ncbi:ATP-binding protein [Microbacterium lacticum]